MSEFLPVQRDKLDNDIFWTFYTPGDNQRIQWQGYDDRYWWENSENDMDLRRQKDKQGRIWEVDFNKNTVREYIQEFDPTKNIDPLSGKARVLNTHTGMYEWIENKIWLDDGTFNLNIPGTAFLYAFKNLTGDPVADALKKKRESHPRTPHTKEIEIAKMEGQKEVRDDFISSVHS